MSSSRNTLFDFDSSSSSDDSDIDDLLDDDMEQFVLPLATKELQEPLRKKRRGSKVGRLCTPRNRVLGIAHAGLLRVGTNISCSPIS
jgi:hypothetical protein